MHIDLNCDMGEGIGNDELIMPYITSANIACGYHAGDEETMKKTILLAKKYNVNIGAHPSFLDRENFGRTEIKFPPEEVYELVTKQIKLLQKNAAKNNASLHHVKPHGALYNMAAKNKELAKAIAEAVKNIDKNLILFGLSNSFLISESKAIGLKTASEVFADRTYQDDGSLTPRSQPNALIQNTDEAIQHVLLMVKQGKVKTISGKEIPIVAETICIHGDGAHAVEFAKSIRALL
jgi:Uncharacterized proteins, homologs of lactam utilization protein B